GNNEVILNTTNGGKTWRPQNPGIPGDFYCVSFKDANNGYVGGYNTFGLGGGEGGGLLLSTRNGGASWESAVVDEGLNGMKALSNGAVWAVGRNFYALFSTDGGNNWNTPTIPSASGSTLPPDFNSVDFAGASQGWIAGNSSVLYHTTDGGSSW